MATDKSVSELNQITTVKDDDLYLVSQKNASNKYESHGIKWSTVKNNVKTYIQGDFVRTDSTNQNIAGTKTFTGNFVYSGMEEANTNANRTIWFSDNTTQGKPVYDNDLKYNPSTNVLDVKKLNSGVELVSSPLSSATGNEVVDAAWVNKKILDLNLYTPPATLTSIRVYMSPTGNDTTALTAFKDLISKSDVQDQTKLAEKPFKTLRAAVNALGLVRSSRIGFTFYIFALPGTYTMSLNISSTGNVNGSTTLRHPDCNDYSGSQIILRGAHTASDTNARKGEVKFTFNDVNTERGGLFGYDSNYIALINASIQNICFCQNGLTFNAQGDVIYTKPCESSEISFGSTYILTAAKGKNSVINCECYCKPVKDNNNIWRAYSYILIHSESTIDIYSTDDYFRHKDGETIIGNRCCFYGLYCFNYIQSGKILTSWRTFDFYFNNCRSIYNIGDDNEYSSVLSHWVNHVGNLETYQAWELDNVYRMFILYNNSSILIRNNSNKKYDDLYNPLKNGYLEAIVVRNSPEDFQLSNVSSFTSKVTNGQLNDIIDRTDYDRLVKFQSYYEKV